MTAESAVYRTKRDVRFRVVRDEAVVVRQEDAEVIALNEVGASILALLDSRRSLGEILDVLLEQYDVDRDTLSNDLSRFLGELVGAGVVEEA
jgi:pyrroloquinoline quinone biosynthesis protein D